MRYDDDNNQKESKQRVQTFHVPPIKKGTEEERRALNELAVLQKKNLSDYKEWAKNEISYDDIITDDVNAGTKLKKMNDAYAISLYTNCLSGLSQGLSLSTLITTVSEFKMLKKINPTFEQDLSRAMLNLRDSWELTAADGKPSEAKVKLDLNISSKAGEMMDNQISQNLEDGSIDEMTMSPRQLAVLKMNFMEQAYVDMRRLDVNSIDYNYDLQTINDNYETACLHLQQIAKNGGFDMTVVAAEERHLVGLKIADNPDYALMFNETSGVYGVEAESNGRLWSDVFKTADGENYTMAYNADDVQNTKAVVQGSFTIRQPINKTARRQQDFDMKCERYAEQLAAMAVYVNSKDCEWPDSVKRTILSEEKQKLNSYREQLMNMYLDDGVVKSRRQAKAMVQSRFDEHYELQYDIMMEGVKSGDNVEAYQDFVNELNHVIDKECCRIMGHSSKTETDIRQNIDDIIKTGRERDRLAGAKSRSDFDILQDVRTNLMNDMSVEERFKLLYHVGNNMEQGYVSHGDYKRYDNPSQHKDAYEDIDMGDDGKSDPSEHDLKKPSKSSERESIDIPDTSPDDPDDSYEL